MENAELDRLYHDGAISDNTRRRIQRSLDLEHAGLGPGRLYPGSWSQYSATDRPAATGP